MWVCTKVGSCDCIMWKTCLAVIGLVRSTCQADFGLTSWTNHQGFTLSTHTCTHTCKAYQHSLPRSTDSILDTRVPLVTRLLTAWHWYFPASFMVKLLMVIIRLLRENSMLVRLVWRSFSPSLYQETLGMGTPSGAKHSKITIELSTASPL